MFSFCFLILGCSIVNKLTAKIINNLLVWTRVVHFAIIIMIIKYNNSFVLFTKCYWSDQIKKDEMGGDCSTDGGDKKCVHNFNRKT
jgi:hypothetical protein